MDLAEGHKLPERSENTLPEEGIDSVYNLRKSREIIQLEQHRKDLQRYFKGGKKGVSVLEVSINIENTGDIEKILDQMNIHANCSWMRKDAAGHPKLVNAVEFVVLEVNDEHIKSEIKRILATDKYAMLAPEGLCVRNKSGEKIYFYLEKDLNAKHMKIDEITGTKLHDDSHQSRLVEEKERRAFKHAETPLKELPIARPDNEPVFLTKANAPMTAAFNLLKTQPQTQTSPNPSPMTAGPVKTKEGPGKTSTL